MRSLVVALLALALSSSSLAQKTEADLRARLVDKPLYLRGQWGADKLEFDSSGRLQGKPAIVSFTLSGIAIDSLKLTNDGMDLEGQRVGLEFAQNGPQRVGLLVQGRMGSRRAEKMAVHIQRPADGDYTAALDAIFTGDLADLVSQLPAYWQSYASQHLLPTGDAAPPRTETPVGTRRIGGGVLPPKLLSKVDPQFDDAARALHYQAIVLVNMLVDESGVPSHTRILRPAGLGLDEQAIAAVSQYRFKPAMENGSPVTVELNVEVNFQIF